MLRTTIACCMSTSRAGAMRTQQASNHRAVARRGTTRHKCQTKQVAPPPFNMLATMRTVQPLHGKQSTSISKQCLVHVDFQHYSLDNVRASTCWHLRTRLHTQIARARLCCLVYATLLDQAFTICCLPDWAQPAEDEQGLAQPFDAVRTCSVLQQQKALQRHRPSRRHLPLHAFCAACS